jgi:thiamine biosynthesis lipoprotein
MGTTWSLKLDYPAMVALDDVKTVIEAALNRVVSQMSTWESDSDICRYNRATAGNQQVLEPEFSAVLDCALHWAEASGGAIDPTVGPLVTLWGFGADADRTPAWPSPASLGAARARVNWAKLSFDRTSRTLTQPGGTSLDFSGIAKGFAVDQIVEAVQGLGIDNMLVEIGGELRGAGRRPGGMPWQVQLDGAPDTTQRISLFDYAIATSGDRWHAHEINGRRWSHTIDPRSGEPTKPTLASVTVMHRHCMQADALATVLTVLGRTEGFAFAQHHGLAAFFVSRNDALQRILVTDAWQDLNRA